MNNVIPNDLVSQEFSTSLFIGDIEIRRDKDGRYCLNDFHRAAGGDDKFKPSNWLRTQQAVEFIKLLEYEKLESGYKAVKSHVGKFGGTYGVKKIIYAYAMWISPEFLSKVIDVYDSAATMIFRPTWSEVREQGVIARKHTTDTVKVFVQYAESQGSMNADKYLFNIPKGVDIKNLRGRLNSKQLIDLAATEQLIDRVILEGINLGVDYHTVYAGVKAKSQAFGDLIGKTDVGIWSISRDAAKRLDSLEIKEPSAVYA